MGAIMIFIDGIGLGDNDPLTNPFVSSSTPYISQSLGNNLLCLETAGFNGEKASLLSLDATLGVPGTPQSATGQTTLFTGENAALLLGKHLNRYPNKALKEVLCRKGIFTQLLTAGLAPTFLNAYRPLFFKDLKEGLTRPYSCSTMLNYYAGLPFRTLEEVKRGRAVFMDITNEYLEKMGYSVTIRDPEEAAQILVDTSLEYDFTLFEYFLSDVAGHLADRQQSEKIVRTLDEFIGGVLNKISTEDTLLIITSDHGNLEDSTHRGHTLNPVPALLSGPWAWRHKAAEELKDLTGVVGLIKNYLGVY